MHKDINLNDQFGRPKKYACKNLKKIQISVHPEFMGFHLCYLNIFHSLSTDLDIFNRPRELHVWKFPHLEGYVLINNIHWYMHYISQNIKSVNLIVHNHPQPDLSKDNFHLLHQDVSHEFIQFLQSTKYDIQKVNPTKLQHLINKHLSTQILLDLNKKSSNKPHHQMSLELLAQLLSCSRNQLNQRIKNINQQSTQVFNELSQHSRSVKELIDHPDSFVTTEKIWRS